MIEIRLTKTYFTTQKNYYMYNMPAEICMFVKACDFCQIANIKSMKHRQYHPRIQADYSPMKGLLVDIKCMPKGTDDFKFHLITTC